MGTKHRGSYRERTALVQEVWAWKQMVADHAWPDFSPDLEVLAFSGLLLEGTQLEFKAVARPYRKDPSFRDTAIFRPELDYRLIEVSNVLILPG